MDLTKLDNITLPNVLHWLADRFRRGQYYSSAGCVVIAFNPCSAEEGGGGGGRRDYSVLPSADDDEVVKKFMDYFRKGKTSKGLVWKEEFESHVLSIGVQSLYNLKNVGNEQMIIVSGDSGAGKTTCTQQLIQFFTFDENRKGNDSTLERKIYAATLLLEALGNAKTSSNPNSSRFGRLVKLKYDSECKIIGAEIQTYLLEKHRVAKGNPNERNFHIFHYLLQGVSNRSLPDVDQHEEQELFKTGLWASVIEEVDLRNFEQLCLLSRILSLEQKIPDVFNYLIAIIHLLAINFQQEEYSYEDKENMENGFNNPVPFTVTNASQYHLDQASHRLGVNSSDLEKALLYKRFSAGKRRSVSVSPCYRREECESRLQALVSTLYEKLFENMVEVLNSTISDIKSNQYSNRQVTDDRIGPSSQASVAILDLYGFENLEYNHLEQLCINYANERIQQVQIQVLKGHFEEEQRMADLEPVELNRVEQDFTLRLEELHKQVFGILNQASILNRANASDEQVYQDLVQNTKGSRFIRTKIRHDPSYSFVIKHYASYVNYAMAGMKNKNMDLVPQEFISILAASSSKLVTECFQSSTSQENSGISTPNGTAKKAKNTILTRFKFSVDQLVEELRETDSRDLHFIKCIRPNPDLIKGKVDFSLVEKQLYACGIVDIMKIAGNGVPIRMSLAKFHRDFDLAIKSLCGVTRDFMEQTETLSKFVNPFVLKFGYQHAFLDEDAFLQLRKLVSLKRRTAASRIQRTWKLYHDRKYKIAMLESMTSQPHRNTSGSGSDTSIYMTPMARSSASSHVTFLSAAPSPSPSMSSTYFNSSEAHEDFSGIMEVDACDLYDSSTSGSSETLNLNEHYDNVKESTISASPSIGELNLSALTLTEDEGPSHSDENINLSASSPSRLVAQFDSPDFDNNTIAISRRPRTTATDGPRNIPVSAPPIYYHNGVLSKRPLHTSSTEPFRRRTALGFFEKRFCANGIQDAFEDYGLVLQPINPSP